MVKNKFIFFIVLSIIFLLIFSFGCYATNTTSYVWSEISSPIVTTSSTISEGDR